MTLLVSVWAYFAYNLQKEKLKTIHKHLIKKFKLLASRVAPKNPTESCRWCHWTNWATFKQTHRCTNRPVHICIYIQYHVCVSVLDCIHTRIRLVSLCLARFLFFYNFIFAFIACDCFIIFRSFCGFFFLFFVDFSANIWRYVRRKEFDNNQLEQTATECLKTWR